MSAKRKINKSIEYALLIALVIVFIALVQKEKAYEDGQFLYENLREEVVPLPIFLDEAENALEELEIMPQDNTRDVQQDSVPVKEQEQVQEVVEVAIQEVEAILDPPRKNLTALAAQNEDLVGWIELIGTAIDYPVVKGADNAYYLTHNFLKQESIVGTIFMDQDNSPDFTDPNTVLYGHNMKDGSMFHALKAFRRQEVIDQDPMLYITLQDRTLTYEIVSVYVAEADYDYRYHYREGEGYLDFLERITAKSCVALDRAPLVETDRILTLSTCIYDFKDARLVVHVRLVR